MRKLSENRGKAGKISVHVDEGFGFTHLETRTLEEIAKVDLDHLPLRKQLRLRLQSAIFLSTHPRNQTFSVWPGGELWSPSMTEEGPQGEALMRFQEVGCSEAPDAINAPC